MVLPVSSDAGLLSWSFEASTGWNLFCMAASTSCCEIEVAFAVLVEDWDTSEAASAMDAPSRIS